MRFPVPGLLRDLSLRHKILLANFLMVLVPVLLIALLGTLLLAGLRFTGTLRQAELALLWPERGPAMEVSYAVSDLRWQSERGGKKGERFVEACRLLERNGVQVVILRRTPAGAPTAPHEGKAAHGEKASCALPGTQAAPALGSTQAPPAPGSAQAPSAQRSAKGRGVQLEAGGVAPAAEADGMAAGGTEREAPSASREAQAPRPEGAHPEEAAPAQPSASTLLYASPGADAAAVVREARRSIGAPDAEGTRWQQGEFAFVHRAHNGCEVYAYGRLPLPAPGQADAEAEYQKNAVEGLAFFLLLLALAFIIWLGLSLARLISRQVLDPLAALREAASEVGRGNLSGRIAVRSQDEVGETCACFDRMRADLLAAREAQERYEQGRRELIAGISHDLSTPLTAISGYATGLADGIARTPERRRRYAERITALVAQLSHLVDRLFLLSRLDLGRVAFHCVPLGVHAYLGAWAAERRAAWEAKGHALRYEAAEAARGCRASLDAAELSRVLENFESNSLKYGGDAAGNVSVVLSLQLAAGGVRIVWRDHGKGAPEEELPRLFESFYRADKSRGEQPGHGLGMAIAARIVTGMGGRIWAEQAAGGGLAVCMEFPVLPPEEMPDGAQAAAAGAAQAGGRKASAVEDGSVQTAAGGTAPASQQIFKEPLMK